MPGFTAEAEALMLMPDVVGFIEKDGGSQGMAFAATMAATLGQRFANGSGRT